MKEIQLTIIVSVHDDTDNDTTLHAIRSALDNDPYSVWELQSVSVVH
jgi:hypothetical protein